MKDYNNDDVALFISMLTDVIDTLKNKSEKIFKGFQEPCICGALDHLFFEEESIKLITFLQECLIQCHEDEFAFNYRIRQNINRFNTGVYDYEEFIDDIDMHYWFEPGLDDRIKFLEKCLNTLKMTYASRCSSSE